MNAAGGFVGGWGWFTYLLGAAGLLAVTSSLVRLVPLGLHGLFHRDPPWSALPLSGGAWLEDQLARRGLDDVVVAMTDGGENAAATTHGIIHLTMDTWRQRTVQAWATAAHELGHVVIERRLGPLAWLLLPARAAEWWTRLGYVLLGINLLLVDPSVHLVAAGCLLTGVALTAVLAAEELAVSTWALGTLAADPRLPAQVGTTRTGLVPTGRALRRVLAEAWGTYVVQIVGRGLAVAMLPAFAAWMTLRPTVSWHPGPLSTWAAPLAGAVVGLAALRVAWSVVGLLAPRFPAALQGEKGEAVAGLGHASWLVAVHLTQLALVGMALRHGPLNGSSVWVALAAAPYATLGVSLATFPLLAAIGGTVLFAHSKLMAVPTSGDRSDPVMDPAPTEAQLEAMRKRVKAALRPRRPWTGVSRLLELRHVMALPLAIALLLA